MSVMISLLPERLFWLEESVLTATVVWDSGDSPVLAVGGTSVFCPEINVTVRRRKVSFLNIR